MKLLHSADWHLDSPLAGRSGEEGRLLRHTLARLPETIVTAAKRAGCQLMLLSGDLFDAAPAPASVAALKEALAQAEMPVCIAPGNHDFCAPDSLWLREAWPENVHIFTGSAVSSICLPELDCRVYGAAFTGPEMPGLLRDFRAQGPEAWHLGVFHGDPTQRSSPYAPVTAQQIEASGLHYLALGHIHKGGSIRAGNTLCAWPGCPAGRGYDEDGVKGVNLVTLESGGVRVEFLPLDTPRFFDLEAAGDAASALSALLPPAPSQDFYRVTLTGESEPMEEAALAALREKFPHLDLRDRTVSPAALWERAGQDSLEGVYFSLLKERLDAQPEDRDTILLAARISRQILLGEEVTLP